MTGHRVGERGVDGTYPADSVNRAVVDRLAAFAKARKEAEGDDDERGKKR